MGILQNLQSKAKNLQTQPFHILTITLLTILLPLSFLLLARRLSCYTYLFATNYIIYPQNTPHPLILIHIIPSIYYLLLSIFSIATLLHGLRGKITLFTESPGRPRRLFTAWILLCVVQVCVGLGVEGSIAAGIDGHGFEKEKGLISRVVFFLGLHETMVYWSRSVVRPVVDDTVFGSVQDESWVQRVSLGLCFGWLWGWRLRDEVESLVLVAEVKREMLMGVNLGDLLGWWLYYLTVTIGMVRIVTTLMWFVMVFLFRKLIRVNNVESCEYCGAENKV